MYLRRISRKNKNGTETAYLQLAHNEWDAVRKCAQAKVVYSFGREDQMDAEALKRLAESIARVLPASDTLAAQAALQGSVVSFQGSKAYRGA